MTKILTILLLMICFASCRTAKLPPAETKIETKDSIIERETVVYRDTTIILPGDTTEITIPCPDVTINEYAGKGRVKLSARSDGKGNVKINCAADSLTLVIDSLKNVIREKERYHSTVKETKVPYPVEVVKYRVPRWCWWVLIYSISLTCWVFRKPLLAFGKKLFGL